MSPPVVVESRETIKLVVRTKQSMAAQLYYRVPKLDLSFNGRLVILYSVLKSLVRHFRSNKYSDPNIDAINKATPTKIKLQLDSALPTKPTEPQYQCSKKRTHAAERSI